MSAGGRKVSGEEIKGFLNELVFVVNSPNDVELERLIRNEISDGLAKRFKYSGDDYSVFNALFTMISNWMKNKRGRFLTPEEGEKFFQEVEELPSTLSEMRQGVERIEGKVAEIGKVLNNQQACKEPIWFNMMEPVASFTGRGSELKALHDALQKSTGKQAVISQVASISGLGGVGKSELARKYAYKHEKDYDGNVMWINAENFEGMRNSFLDLANNRLGVSPKDEYGNDKTIETIVREVYAFFARRGRKSLFIFDNVEGYKDIGKFLPSSLHPRHKRPYVLITSRDRKWKVRGEGDIEVIQLDEFGEVEALEFVKKALNIENNLQDGEIEELTKELQYFPLALGQAVVYIQDQNEESRLRGDKRFKISDYLKEYHRDAGKLLKKGVYANKDRYTKTVLTTWNITMTYICKKYGFEALNILEIMAYLAPDKIRIEEIFSKLIADDEEKLWNAVKLLNRYSMIKLREGIVNIHRLVQKITRLKLQEKGREEEVLRKTLELVNSGDLAQDSISHVASIWGYASEHSELIDDFYFSSIYSEYRGMSFYDGYKSTPLHLLTNNDDYKAVEAILARVEAQYPDSLYRTINAKDAFDTTLLHLAARSGRLNVVKCLVDKGANIHARAEIYQTPLYSAVKSGELDMVKYFISKGANIDTENWFERNLLYCAVESENFDIAEYLIEEKGIDVTVKYSNGDTLLHEVARYESLNALKYFVDKGIDVDIKGKYNGTLLHWAVAKERIDVVRYLIAQDADVNAKGNDDLTPLDWAVWHTNLKIVKCLVESGSDINAKSKGGWTSFHVIAKGNRVFSGDGFKEMLKVTEYLVQKGANINVKNEDGNTPLHFTAMKGKVDIAKILLKHNADVNAKNNEGKTALDCAANNNHQELVVLLLAHGAVPY